MRRPMTMREVADRNFRNLEKRAAQIAEDAPADVAASIRDLADMIGEARSYSLSVTMEEPGLPPGKLKRFLEDADEDRTRDFVRKGIERQIPCARLEGHDDAEVCDVIVAHLADLSPDHTIDDAIRQAGQDAVTALPKLEHARFNEEVFETMMREAIGLDGRTPERDVDRELQAANAEMILDRLHREPETTPEP